MQCRGASGSVCTAEVIRTSVPQVFIDGQHIGGCDDTYALEKAGKLDGLLGLAG